MASATKDAKYADITRNRFNKAKELAEPVFERVEVNRNLYKGILTLDDTYEWDYSLVDQQVFPLIRNYIARSNPSMTKVRLEARNPADFEKRKINQDFVNWEIGELDLTTLLTRGFYSNYLAGKAYFKSGWKYDPRIVVKNGKYEYEMRPLINRGDLKFVRFNNILIPNRNIPSLYDQPYVIEVIQLRMGDMLKENKAYGYEYWDENWINKMKKAGVTSKALDFEADFVKDSDTFDDMTFNAATFPAACMHTLEGDVIYIPLIDNSEVIINKDRENPYWHGHYPYIDMTAFPEDDEYFSMSVVDAVGDTQIASTEVLNQMLTNIRSINNNMWISGAPAATTPDYMFKQRPSGIIRVAGDPTQIVPVRPQDSTSSMLRTKQELQSDLERTGGISSLYSSGAGNEQVNQTARGAQIINQNIDTNIQMIMDLFGEQVLKRLGNHFCELNAQYVTEEQTFAVTGQKGVRALIAIDPANVGANFDVYTYPSAMVKQTPASRQASLQNLMQTVAKVFPSLGIQTDAVPLAEALIDSYPEMENVEDIVIDIDEKGTRDCNMLLRGQLPTVKIRDDHEALTQYATVFFENHQQEINPQSEQLFQQYVQQHMQFMQAEQEVKAMTTPQIPQPNESINFKDLNPQGQAQMAAQAGINLSPQPASQPNGQATNPQAGTPNPTYNLGKIA